MLESDEEPELEELVESLEEELLELLLDEDELELEEELDEPPPPVLELELLEELLLELEESLLEPPFPPPPPPPQAVSIETVIAAASATAITFFANLMVNFLPHFQNRQRKSSFGPSVSLNLPPPCIDLSSSFDKFVVFNKIVPEIASI